MNSTMEMLSNRHLRLIPTDMDSSRPYLLIHTIRTALLVCVLLVTLFYQVRLGNFVNVETWLPFYLTLAVSFLLNSIYLFFYDRIGYSNYANGVLFGVDVVAVSLLIFFTGTNQALFTFLYLVNLILASVAFPREGAWLVSAWTSICFSALVLFSKDMSGQPLYISIFVNNLAFFAVTALSGRLSEQLRVAGVQLEEAKSDIVALQNFNDLIVSSVNEGLIVVGRTGIVQFHNSEAVKILGEVAQMRMSDVIPELNWNNWVSSMEGGHFIRKEIQMTRGSQIKILEATIMPFLGPDSKSKGWLVRIDDRTDVKILEDQLKQREKLAAVGQLAAGIAHEIRNPLASISGSIQLMVSDASIAPEEQKKLMSIVSREIDRLNNLISEFLEYVRPEQRTNTLVDINPILREVLEMIRFNAKLRQDVKQVLHFQSALLIEGHKDKLKQAFLNLIVNAYQAMDQTASPELEITTVDENNKVVLVVRDNGCGIKEENLNKIFEPFHTTKPQGSGLGLAITHKILEAHRAFVHVQSQVGHGTKFLIEFPSERGIYIEDLRDRKRA